MFRASFTTQHWAQQTSLVIAIASANACRQSKLIMDSSNYNGNGLEKHDQAGHNALVCPIWILTHLVECANVAHKSSDSLPALVRTHVQHQRHTDWLTLSLRLETTHTIKSAQIELNAILLTGLYVHYYFSLCFHSHSSTIFKSVTLPPSPPSSSHGRLLVIREKEREGQRPI